MIKKFSEILQDLFDAIIAAEGKLTDFNIGSVTRTILEAVAAVVEEVYYWLALFLDKFFIATSEGAWLDKRLNDFGLERKAGCTANGRITIGRDTQSPLRVLIPKGTLFVSDEGLEFETVEEVTIETESVDVSGQARMVGKAYNLASGTPLKQAGIAITGIEWAKVKQMGGGLDRETDTELKARVTPYFRSLGRSTKAAIEFAALSVPGVTSVTTAENDPAEGWFKVFIDDGSGTASTDLCAVVAEAVEKYRGFTVKYIVTAPVLCWINVAAIITVKEGYIPEEVRLLVKQAIIAHVNGLQMGQQVYKAALYQTVMSVDGVKNAFITAPNADTNLESREIARTDVERVIVS